MLHFALGVLKALGILLASLVLLILFNVARQLVSRADAQSKLQLISPSHS